MPEVELEETGESRCCAKLYFMTIVSLLMAARVDKYSLCLDRIIMTKRKEKIFQIR